MSKYYVYELIDPRDGKPFYIGKGSGNRCNHHAREAAGGKRSRKCQKIRDIVGAGFEIKINIVDYFDDESLAYIAEATRIDGVGLSNLTNEIPGGLGPETRAPKKAVLPRSFYEKALKDLAQRYLNTILLYERGGKILIAGIDALPVIFAGMDMLIDRLGDDVQFYLEQLAGRELQYFWFSQPDRRRRGLVELDA